MNMKRRILQAAVLAGALGLAACGGGGGGGSSTLETDTQLPEVEVPRSAQALVTGLHFDYTLRSAGESPLEVTDSVPLACAVSGCAVEDLRDLSGTGTRGGFATVSGPADASQLTQTFTGVSVTASETSVRRWGFWGEHGHAAVEIGTGTLSVVDGGQTWRGDFTSAHAVTGGDEVSGTNPAGAGSATWSGIAEAVRIANFTRLPGTAQLRIANLSQPRIDANINLDDGDNGVALRWTGLIPRAGRFSGTSGPGDIEGRFHGPAHEEAWGVFDTSTYVGAFGTERQP